MSVRTFSTSSATSSYSHLLYVNDVDRHNILMGTPSPRTRRESVSYFSMTSSRDSSDSARSVLSLDTSCSSSNSSKSSSFGSATITTPKFADDHYPLISSLGLSPITPEYHSAVLCAKQMTSIHNTFIRAINSVYNHALTISPSTKQCEDFLRFCQILCKMLNHYSTVKNSYLFPAFQNLASSSGVLEATSSDHAAIMREFFTFRNHVLDPNTIKTFDGMSLRRMIEGFAPELIQRLHDQIPIVTSLHVVDSKEVRKVWMQAHKMATDGIDLYLDAPFLLGCQDKSFLIDGESTDCPCVPWVVERLVRKWHAKKHAGIWEFCPSDLCGNRRVLNF